MLWLPLAHISLKFVLLHTYTISIAKVPLYDECKWIMTNQPPAALPNLFRENPVFLHMGSAVTAGIAADILCNPAFVVRTRLMTESVHHRAEAAIPRTTTHQSTIAQTVRTLYAEGGFPIFWRGMTANLLGLSHVAVQFPVTESECNERGIHKTARQCK